MLEKDKKTSRKNYEEIERRALDVLEMGLTVDDMKIPQLRLVLAFYGVEIKETSKEQEQFGGTVQGFKREELIESKQIQEVDGGR